MGPLEIIIIIAAVLFVAAVVIVTIVRRKKNKGCGCGGKSCGSCTGCSGKNYYTEVGGTPIDSENSDETENSDKIE